VEGEVEKTGCPRSNLSLRILFLAPWEVGDDHIVRTLIAKQTRFPPFSALIGEQNTV